MATSTNTIRIYRRVDGVDGISVSSITKYFLLTEMQAEPSESDVGWNTTYPTYDSSTNMYYLYVKEVTIYSNGTSEYTIYLDGNWVTANAYKYLSDATYGGSLTSTGGLAFANVFGAHNLSYTEYAALTGEERTEALRSFMSGLAGDGLAFGAHSSDAYTVAKNYVDWYEGDQSGTEPTRPNFAVTDSGKVITNEMNANNATIKGTIYASSGTFEGAIYRRFYPYYDDEHKTHDIEIIDGAVDCIRFPNLYCLTNVFDSSPSFVYNPKNGIESRLFFGAFMTRSDVYRTISTSGGCKFTAVDRLILDDEVARYQEFTSLTTNVISPIMVEMIALSDTLWLITSPTSNLDLT